MGNIQTSYQPENGIDKRYTNAWLHTWLCLKGCDWLSPTVDLRGIIWQAGEKGEVTVRVPFRNGEDTQLIVGFYTDDDHLSLHRCGPCMQLSIQLPFSVPPV